MLNEHSELNWVKIALCVQWISGIMYTLHILYAIAIYMFKFIKALSH